MRQSSLIDANSIGSIGSMRYFNIIINAQGYNSITVNYDASAFILHSYTKLKDGVATFGDFTANTTITINDCDYIVITMESNVYAGIAVSIS